MITSNLQGFLFFTQHSPTDIYFKASNKSNNKHYIKSRIHKAITVLAIDLHKYDHYMDGLTLDGRIWLQRDGEKVLGHGRVELLERIKESGSIRQAALQMKMSYKQAWDIINQINNKFNQPLVISHRGGKGGGNAVVTDYGLQIIREFHVLQSRFREFLTALEVQ